MRPRRGLYSSLASDIKSLESFHVKCQRHILGIRWYHRIRNTEIAERTGLPPLTDLIIRRRNSLFGHVARLRKDITAHQALQRHIDISGWLGQSDLYDSMVMSSISVAALSVSWYRNG